MAFKDEPLRRARESAQLHGLALGDELGCGVHGIVVATESQPEKVCSAIKAHHREADFVREHDVYIRLKARRVTTIRGCRVPRLLRWDDSLWVIEMTVVSRPYVLDFAGAVLEKPVEFEPDVLADWAVEKQEQFGKHWAEAQAIGAVLASHGIFLLDVSPSNISLVD